MCHAAVWLIDRHVTDKHGPVFKAWGSRVTRAYPDISVTTCHAYEIFYKWKYQCADCQTIIGRHTDSLDCDSNLCGLCQGRLFKLGRFNDDGTPAKPRQATGFSLFVKEKYNEVKQQGHGDENDGGNTSMAHKDIMEQLSIAWKAKKTESAAPSQATAELTNLAGGGDFNMSITAALLELDHS